MVHLVKWFFWIPFSSEKVTISQPSVLNGPLKRGYTGCMFPSSILSPAHTHDSPIITYISFIDRTSEFSFFEKTYFSSSMIAIAMMMWGRTIENGWLMGVNFIYNLIHLVHTPISRKVFLKCKDENSLRYTVCVCGWWCPTWGRS